MVVCIFNFSLSSVIALFISFCSFILSLCSQLISFQWTLFWMNEWINEWMNEWILLLPLPLHKNQLQCRNYPGGWGEWVTGTPLITGWDRISFTHCQAFHLSDPTHPQRDSSRPTCFRLFQPTLIASSPVPTGLLWTKGFPGNPWATKWTWNFWESGWTFLPLPCHTWLGT